MWSSNGDAYRSKIKSFLKMMVSFSFVSMKTVGREYLYAYDITGRTADIRVSDTDNGSTSFKTEYSYNNVDELDKRRITGADMYITSVYDYNDNGQLSAMSYGYYSQDYTYDVLGRLYRRGVNVTEPIRYNYVYYLSN